MRAPDLLENLEGFTPFENAQSSVLGSVTAGNAGLAETRFQALWDL